MTDKTDMGGPAFAAIHEAAKTGNDEELWDSLDALDTEDLRALLLCKFRAKSDAEAWHEYAAAVLSGTWAGRESDFLAQNEVTYEMVAESAGKLADAMMAERSKREGGGDE